MNTIEKEKENQTKEQKPPLDSSVGEAWAEYAPTSSLQEDEPFEVPEIRTELPLPARPLVKGGFAIALSGSALVLIWIFFQLAGGFSWNGSIQSAEEQEKQPVVEKPSSEMTPQEKLQWCLATRKCGDRVDPPLKKPTKTANVNSKITSQRKELAAPSPTRPQVSDTTTQDTVGPPVKLSHVPSPTPPLVSPLPPRPISPVELRAVQPEPPRQKQDPIALLAQASNLGVYTTLGSTNSPGSRSSRRSHLTQLVAAGEGAEASLRPMTNQQLGKIIPVTTRIKAIIATKISWVGNKAEQKFRIQTTEDVKAEDGSILPKGTYLLAQVNQSNSSGYVEVQILSAQINGQEEPIPAGTIIVQGTHGNPLQAEVKNKRRGLSKTIAAAGLAGISEAASAINSTKIIVGDTTGVSMNSGSNMWAGMAKGVAGSLSQQVISRETADNRTSDEPMLVLKEGTKLELFINQPLSI